MIPVYDLRFLTVRKKARDLWDLWTGTPAYELTPKNIPKTVEEGFARDQERFNEIRKAVTGRTEEYLQARRKMRETVKIADDYGKRWEVEFISLPGITLGDVCGAASLILEFYGVQPIPRAESIEDEIILFFEVPATSENYAIFNDRLSELLRMLDERYPTVLKHSAVAINHKE